MTCKKWKKKNQEKRNECAAGNHFKKAKKMQRAYMMGIQTPKPSDFMIVTGGDWHQTDLDL
jgi:hypothetical protein